MPTAAIAAPLVGGALAGGGAAAGGKKGGGAAKHAADQQFQMQQQLFNTGQQAWQPAASYFKALLSGDPTQMAGAVGPTADVLRGQGRAASQQIAATTPAGGEANAAQAGLQRQNYSDIARLTAGVQPAAAQALGQLAGLPMQTGAPNVGSGLKFDTHQQEIAGQSKGALGSGLGQMVARLPGMKNSGGGGAVGSGSTAPAASSPTGKG